MMSQDALRAKGLKALSSPLYCRFVGGYAFSSTASWIQRVCFGWLAWDMTHSPFWLGMIAFAEFLPILLVSPLVGDAIDRYDKKHIILSFEILPAAALTLLIALISQDLLNIPLLFLIAFVVGTSMAISHPAQLAWYPTLLVDRTVIGSAANIYILSLNIARFLGAGVAGLVISLYGISLAVGMAVAGYLIFATVLACIPQLDKRTSARGGGALRGVYDGFRYSLAHPLIGGMLLVIAVTSIGARGVPDLAPAITELALHAPAEWFSMLIAATGVGSVLAGLWNLSMKDQGLALAVRLTIGFALLLAGCTAMIGLAGEFWIAIGLFTALGFSITVTAVKSQQVIQSLVEDSMRGRVNSLYFLTFRGGTAFGALWMGTASTSIGLMATLLLGGLACLVVWARFRNLRLERE